MTSPIEVLRRLRHPPAGAVRGSREGGGAALGALCRRRPSGWGPPSSASSRPGERGSQARCLLPLRRRAADAQGPQSRWPARLRRAARPRPLRHHADAADALRRLLPYAARHSSRQPPRADRGRDQPAAHSLALRRRGGDERDPEGATARASVPLRHARPQHDGRFHRQRHLAWCQGASRRRWPSSRPSGSTTACTGCTTIPARSPSISSASCCSPTTSAMSTTFSSGGGARWRRGKEYDRLIEPGDVLTPNPRLSDLRCRAARLPSMRRRCRPIT